VFFSAVFGYGAHFKSVLRRHGWRVKIDPDNLRTETAKAVARLMSLAQTTC